MKYVNLVYRCYREDDKDTSKFPEQCYADGITDGAIRMLDCVRASLKDWPNAGIDKEIAESIDRICKEYHDKKFREAWEAFTKQGN